jgi:hypothetical protein
MGTRVYMTMGTSEVATFPQIHLQDRYRLFGEVRIEPISEWGNVDNVGIAGAREARSWGGGWLSHVVVMAIYSDPNLN